MKRYPLFLLTIALFPAALFAAIAENLAQEDLVARSDAVVIGSCTRLESVWMERTLVTRATITLDETLKGPSRPALTVLLPGGVDTEGALPISMDYYGAPSLALEEKVFLFLKRVPELPGSFTILGFSQGKFSLVDEEGALFVYRDIRNLGLESGGRIQRGSLTRRPLAGFKREVRDLIGLEEDPGPVEDSSVSPRNPEVTHEQSDSMPESRDAAHAGRRPDRGSG